MGIYVEWVMSNPLLSAFIQFGILGTLGEVASHALVMRRLGLPCTKGRLVLKVLAWGVLGVVVKFGFTGIKGFTHAVQEGGYLPSFMASGLGHAFAVSLMANFFFGPQMMFFHRLEDNLIMREWNFKGMDMALKSLMWFWIPAHTVTFALPPAFQIGLAALWGVVLGFILGFAKSKAATQEMGLAPAVN
ncbi:MAG: hypothetical protein KQI62_13635 [Deltaproteobacteria bacterium]|nr:hypothetical protein [Deltaproteobacteria bacterium]